MYSPEFLRPKGFKSNYRLTIDEDANRLKQDHNLDAFDETKPQYQLAVIQLNSTFVELVDRDYPVRGVFTIIALLIMAGLSWLFLDSVAMTYLRWDAMNETERRNDVDTLILVGSVSAIFLSFCAYVLRRESFSYTHFPIRLNRRNRKIYVWRRDGSVLSEAWDKVFFCLRRYNFNGLAINLGWLVSNVE